MPSTSRFAISSVISQFGISRFVTSRFAAAAFVLLTCALLPAVQERSTLSAQTVRGRVTDGRDQAVPGAVVTLLDSADQIVARALTPEDGTFRLTVARPGTYRLRTARIGFQPTLLPSIQLGRGETRVQAVRIAFIPIALAAVRVAARSACHSDESADAANAFALWDQVRTALTATQLSASARSVTATTITFQRALDPRQRRIRQQSQQLRTDYVSQPWRAAPLDSIRRFGYVLTDANDISTFFAPDLNVLLSSTFLEDHCLRVGESEVPGEVALAFEPNAARANVVDIQGMMILDRATGALRRMEFGTPAPRGPSRSMAAARWVLRSSPTAAGRSRAGRSACR